MPDYDDQRWYDAVAGAILKNKYYDLILIFAVILAFFTLIIVSSTSI